MRPPDDPTREVAERIADLSGSEVVEHAHHFTIVARCAWCKTADPAAHADDCPYPRKDPK
jgi:hypothetical protein